MSKQQAVKVKDRWVIWPLQSVNFFMADMQAGIGSFLGIFLLAYGLKSGLIGSVTWAKQKW